MKGTFSNTQAKAYKVEGEISASFLSKAAKRLSMVSFSPTTTLLYLSVLAVHRTTTLSTLVASLNALYSYDTLGNRFCKFQTEYKSRQVAS